ncbi:hypothetical protein D3C76_1868770 [compost metagenome]
MQRVQLDAVYPALSHRLQRGQMVLMSLSGQANDQVAAYLQAAFPRQAAGLLITEEIVATVDAL